jgi:uncharacterized protein YkwD
MSKNYLAVPVVVVGMFLAVSAFAKDAPQVAHPAKKAPAVHELHADQPSTAYEQQIFDLTNQDRAANNRAPLTYDTRLEASATLKCQDMVKNHYFRHDNGQGVFYFFPKNWAGAGENLEEGMYSPARIEQAWMSSPLHRENILGQFDSMGVAQCADYTVVHFVMWPANER